MRFITEESRLPLLPCVATIGCFDGVHRGHRYLIEQVRREARARGLQSTLITFPVHPRQVMQSDYRPQWLTCLPQKKDLLQQEDADYCILLPFTHKLSLLSALGIEVIHAQALVENGVSISSSLIRNLLKQGDAACANRYLGYRYYLDGKVVSGYQVGRKLGFPTANLQPSCTDKLIPKEGVYAVYAYAEGKRYAGMLNIGHRPTVDNGTERSIEAHIIGFEGNLYQHYLRIDFLSFIRKEQKFSNLKELIGQLQKDKEYIQMLYQ